MNIPKIIHQTWKTEKIPKSMREYQKTWKKNHPQWEYKLWTDKTCRELVVEKYPQYLKVYDKFEQNIQRVDFWKYLVLHAYGGVYTDLDSESLKPLDPLVSNIKKDKKIILGEVGGMIECAFMISTPNHPFWLKLCDYIEHEYKNKSVSVQLLSTFTTLGVLWTTGPFALTDFIHNHHKKSWNVIIKPSNYFSPMEWIDTDDKESKIWPKESYVVHHFADTWQTSWEKSISHIVRNYWGILIVILIIVFIFILIAIFWFWRG